MLIKQAAEKRKILFLEVFWNLIRRRKIIFLVLHRYKINIWFFSGESQ
jgi:hypothetical protein